MALFAQEVVELPMDQFLSDLIASLGGFKGASAMGIVAIVVQLLMKLSKTKLGEYAGRYKLLVVYGLTVVAGVLSLMTAGHLSFMAALIHANSLAAFQVLGHEVVDQFIRKKDEPAKVETPTA